MRIGFHKGMLLGFLMLPTFAQADDDVVPVLGSKEVPVRFVGSRKLSRALNRTVSQVNERTLSTLNQLPRSSCQEESPWELRTVSVGLGISIEAGIPLLTSVGAEAKLRLLYAPNDDFVNP